MSFTIEAINEALFSKNKKYYAQSPIGLKNSKINSDFVSSLEEVVETEPKFKGKILLSRDFDYSDYRKLDSIKNIKVKYFSKRAEKKEKEKMGFEIANRTCFKRPEIYFPWDNKDRMDPYLERLVRHDWRSHHGSAIDYLKRFLRNFRTGIRLNKKYVA